MQKKLDFDALLQRYQHQMKNSPLRGKILYVFLFIAEMFVDL